MLNKNVLPYSFQFPALGQRIFLSKVLMANLEFIIFTGPWAPFRLAFKMLKSRETVTFNSPDYANTEQNISNVWIRAYLLSLKQFSFIIVRYKLWNFRNSWKLDERYKKREAREVLAERLSKYISYLAFFNFLLMPFIFVWQFIFHLVHYAEVRISFFIICWLNGSKSKVEPYHMRSYARSVTL